MDDDTRDELEEETGDEMPKKIPPIMDDEDIGSTYEDPDDPLKDTDEEEEEEEDEY